MTDTPALPTVYTLAEYRVGQFRCIVSLERDGNGPDHVDLLTWLRLALYQGPVSGPDLVAQDVAEQLRHREHWPGERRYAVDVWQATSAENQPVHRMGCRIEGVA